MITSVAIHGREWRTIQEKHFKSRAANNLKNRYVERPFTFLCMPNQSGAHEADKPLGTYVRGGSQHLCGKIVTKHSFSILERKAKLAGSATASPVDSPIMDQSTALDASNTTWSTPVMAPDMDFLFESPGQESLHSDGGAETLHSHDFDVNLYLSESFPKQTSSRSLADRVGFPRAIDTTHHASHELTSANDPSSLVQAPFSWAPPESNENNSNTKQVSCPPPPFDWSPLTGDSADNFALSAYSNLDFGVYGPFGAAAGVKNTDQENEWGSIEEVGSASSPSKASLVPASTVSSTGKAEAVDMTGREGSISVSVDGCDKEVLNYLLDVLRPVKDIVKIDIKM